MKPGYTGKKLLEYTCRIAVGEQFHSQGYAVEWNVAWIGFLVTPEIVCCCYI